MEILKTNLPYIHGFSPQEQERLYEQAKFTESLLYADVDFSSAGRILEVGSGVGAQSAILLRRFPEIELTCIEINDRQLATAEIYLQSLPCSSRRYELHKMDATRMSFADQQFDGAFICWVLEHLKDHAAVLKEVQRVLKPGAPLYVTEVMNSSFFLDPYSPAIWKYWMAFNDYQYDNYGDPFVGAKLGNLLHALGYEDIRTLVKYWHLDSREPYLRRQAIAFWKDLLLSAEEVLLRHGLVTKELVAQVKNEFTIVEDDAQAVFFDAFVQGRGTCPNYR